MTDAIDYLILVEGGAGSNHSASSPDLPGCVATGKTTEECVAEMRIAIAGHLDAMRANGEAAPRATGPGVYVAYPAAA